MISFQAVLQASDGYLTASIGWAVIGRCANMLDANLLQLVTEPGPKTAGPIAPAFVWDPGTVCQLHDPFEGFLCCLIFCDFGPEEA